MRRSITPAATQLVACVLALGCIAVFAQGPGPSAGEARAARGTEAMPHRLVVAPAAALDDAEFAKGCWVRFYDGKNFKGEELTVMGPLKLPGMALASPWWRRWNSVLVGPRARVTIHAGEDFKNRSMTLAPGQRTTDLSSKESGWFGKIQSADVACSPP